jgi:hypothetical protein
LLTLIFKYVDQIIAERVYQGLNEADFRWGCLA